PSECRAPLHVARVMIFVSGEGCPGAGGSSMRGGSGSSGCEGGGGSRLGGSSGGGSRRGVAGGRGSSAGGRFRGSSIGSGAGASREGGGVVAITARGAVRVPALQ